MLLYMDIRENIAAAVHLFGNGSHLLSAGCGVRYCVDGRPCHHRLVKDRDIVLQMVPGRWHCRL